MARSGAVAVELESVAHEETHDLLSREDAQSTARAGALAEALGGWERVLRREQERNPVPGVALHLRGGCVIAGHGEGGRAEFQQVWQQGVHLFYDRGLPLEVAVLAGGVGCLDMDEEE